MAAAVQFGDVLEWAENFDLSHPFGRLAANIFVNYDNPGARLVGMFTAYFDASGTPDSPYLIVAGYVANVYQWQVFESSWKSIHERFGVEVPFHMADFIAATANPERYAAQKNARQDYVEIAKKPKEAKEFFRSVCIAEFMLANCGFSCIINMAIYNEISSLLDLRKVVPPYALGARSCIAAVHKWEDDYSIQNPVEIIFERGDLEQDKFRKLVLDEGGPEPIFRKKSEYAGLQAADHYAWEQLFYSKKQKTGQHLPARESFKFLLNLIPKVHTEVNREGLIKLCHSKGINPLTGIGTVGAPD